MKINIVQAKDKTVKKNIINRYNPLNKTSSSYEATVLKSLHNHIIELKFKQD